MLRHAYLEDLGFNYILASEPFSLDELYDLVSAPLREPMLPSSGKPVLMDFREVDLTRLTEPDLRRFLMRKSVLPKNITDIPVAYVVGTLQDQALIRMASMYSDLSGVTNEDRITITEVLSEAVSWLMQHTGGNTPPADHETRLRSVAGQGG
ncbi:hypothetical protein E7681_17450 [Thalassobius vesicularis]|uniref:Uncharacterized protein n=1 Tax=Thalassobius vesicularis TaxID=1294297 RepID=A0A4S3M4Z1_9RHOB|nr:hypothetical protein [Thalassobius vesicularis]THD71590.1 hypothetical protein E7681_17450 [Thalassobius vesicularis]